MGPARGGGGRGLRGPEPLRREQSAGGGGGRGEAGNSGLCLPVPSLPLPGRPVVIARGNGQSAAFISAPRCRGI